MQFKKTKRQLIINKDAYGVISTFEFQKIDFFAYLTSHVYVFEYIFQKFVDSELAVVVVVYAHNGHILR